MFVSLWYPVQLGILQNGHRSTIELLKGVMPEKVMPGRFWARGFGASYGRAAPNVLCKTRGFGASYGRAAPNVLCKPRGETIRTKPT